ISRFNCLAAASCSRISLSNFRLSSAGSFTHSLASPAGQERDWYGGVELSSQIRRQDLCVVFYSSALPPLQCCQLLEQTRRAQRVIACRGANGVIPAIASSRPTDNAWRPRQVQTPIAVSIRATPTHASVIATEARVDTKSSANWDTRLG